MGLCVLSLRRSTIWSEISSWWGWTQWYFTYVRSLCQRAFGIVGLSAWAHACTHTSYCESIGLLRLSPEAASVSVWSREGLHFTLWALRDFLYARLKHVDDYVEFIAENVIWNGQIQVLMWTFVFVSKIHKAFKSRKLKCLFININIDQCIYSIDLFILSNCLVRIVLLYVSANLFTLEEMDLNTKLIFTETKSCALTGWRQRNR